MTDQQRAANPMGSGDREGDLLRSLPEGHVIHTLVSEHVQILGFLRELGTLRIKLLQMATLEESRAIALVTSWSMVYESSSTAPVGRIRSLFFSVVTVSIGTLSSWACRDAAFHQSGREVSRRTTHR